MADKFIIERKQRERVLEVFTTDNKAEFDRVRREMGTRLGFGQRLEFEQPYFSVFPEHSSTK